MEGIKYQVWMSELIYFDEGKDEHDVHDGGIKLQAGVAGTEVKDSTANALQNHADSKGIENAVLLLGAKYLTFQILFYFEDH